MNIKIELERQHGAAVDPQAFGTLLADLESVLKQFPKLRKLSPLEGDSFRIDLKTIGSSVAKIAHDVSFGMACKVDRERGELVWTAMPKVGNAALEGRLGATGNGQGLRLKVRGELRDVPVPLMYRLVAPAFIQGKFSALADAWLERLAEAA